MVDTCTKGRYEDQKLLFDKLPSQNAHIVTTAA